MNTSTSEFVKSLFSHSQQQHVYVCILYSKKHPHLTYMRVSVCVWVCVSPFALYRRVFLRKVEINMELNWNGRLQSDRAVLVHTYSRAIGNARRKKDEHHNKTEKNLKRNSRKMLSGGFPPSTAATERTGWRNEWGKITPHTSTTTNLNSNLNERLCSRQ